MAKAELATVEDFKIVTGMEAMDEELRAELEKKYLFAVILYHFRQ